MPTRFLGEKTRPGRQQKHKRIIKVQSDHFDAYIDYLEITQEYLVSIFNSNQMITPILEFTFAKSKLSKGWGMEKFVTKLLYKMEKRLVTKDRYKKEYVRIFHIPYKEVNGDQRRFMKEYSHLLK